MSRHPGPSSNTPAGSSSREYLDVGCDMCVRTKMFAGAGSPLSAGTCELLAAYVAALNGAVACHRCHAEAARRLGLDPRLAQDAISDLDGAPVTPRMKALLRYLRKLTLVPASVAQPDIDTLRRTGWSEAAIAQASLVCGHVSLTSRLAAGLGLLHDDSAHGMGAAEASHKTTGSGPARAQ